MHIQFSPAALMLLYCVSGDLCVLRNFSIQIARSKATVSQGFGKELSFHIGMKSLNSELMVGVL